MTIMMLLLKSTQNILSIPRTFILQIKKIEIKNIILLSLSFYVLKLYPDTGSDILYGLSLFLSF